MSPDSSFYTAEKSMSHARSSFGERQRPDSQHVEIHLSADPNGNHPFAEGLAHRLKREPLPAKDCKPLVRVDTEPQPGETVAAENIDRLLGALLNHRDVRLERQQARRFPRKRHSAVPSNDAQACHVRESSGLESFADEWSDPVG